MSFLVLTLISLLVVQPDGHDPKPPAFEMTLAMELPNRDNKSVVVIEVKVDKLPPTIDEFREVICQIRKTRFSSSQRSGAGALTKRCADEYQIVRIGMALHANEAGYVYEQSGEEVHLWFFEPPIGPRWPVKVSLKEFACGPQGGPQGVAEE
jgi:hypothetical protein